MRTGSKAALFGMALALMASSLAVAMGKQAFH
jgi:hypothetical protein